MWDILIWLVVGLVAGGLARLIIPGKQPLSLLMTLVLGLAGSLLGGFGSLALRGDDAPDAGFHTGGLVASVLGAAVLLAFYVSFARRSRVDYRRRPL